MQSKVRQEKLDQVILRELISMRISYHMRPKNGPRVKKPRRCERRGTLTMKGLYLLSPEAIERPETGSSLEVGAAPRSLALYERRAYRTGSDLWSDYNDVLEDASYMPMRSRAIRMKSAMTMSCERLASMTICGTCWKNLR